MVKLIPRMMVMVSMGPQCRILVKGCPELLMADIMPALYTTEITDGFLLPWMTFHYSLINNDQIML